jgi:hypothetical protein
MPACRKALLGLLLLCLGPKLLLLLLVVVVVLCVVAVAAWLRLLLVVLRLAGYPGLLLHAVSGAWPAGC